MRIGIYKPYKKLFFVDDSQDNAAWSYEVVNTAHILAERGHDVHILSDNDLPKNTHTSIRNKFVQGELSKCDRYDRILLWCGSFALDEYGPEVVNILRSKTDKLDLMLTDRALIPGDGKLMSSYDFMEEFDNIYIQGTKQIFSEKDVLGSMSELVLYKHKYQHSLAESVSEKTVEFYFGGTERDRLMDFLEYVWRPGHLVTTKSKFLGLENRIERGDFKKALDSAKYSVVITDVLNNKEHFISPRPYECYIHDIIPFFDSKYDPDGYYCSHDDFRRVKSYKEMREKMNYLNEHSVEYIKILLAQREIASKDEFVSGTHIYNKLMGL